MVNALKVHGSHVNIRPDIGPDFSAQRFSFLVIFFFFLLGRAVAGLTASFRAHVNIVSLLTYLLTNDVLGAVRNLFFFC